MRHHFFSILIFLFFLQFSQTQNSKLLGKWQTKEKEVIESLEATFGSGIFLKGTPFIRL
jgi:hypothetical protein